MKTKEAKDTITRYAVTYINSDGMRQIAHANQGRNFKDTLKEAQELAKAMMENNSEDTLIQIFGKQALGTFKGSPIECYPNGDAAGIFVTDH